MIERIEQRLAMSIRLRAFASMMLAGFVGLLVAIPGHHWVLYFAGGGGASGTTVPMNILFGPAYLVWYYCPGLDGRGPLDNFFLSAAMLGLYAVYAASLAWGRVRSIGKGVAVAVLFLHYALVLVLTMVEPYMSSFRGFTNLLGSVPFYHSFGLIEYFFLLHIAVVAFSISSWPVSREGVKRTVQWVVFVSLISLAYVAWAIATSTR